MVQRFLLDWVHGQSGGASVAKLDEPPAFILADVAEAVLAFSDVTMPRAQVAVETAIGHRLPPARLVDFRLQDC